jgi:PAS domain S-box-containing protein
MNNELGPIVDVLPGLVWCTRPDGRLEFLNRRWREYTGLDLEQGSDVEWHSAVHPADLPHWLECWRSTAALGQPWELELRLRRFDGAYRWFVCRAAPQTDASEQIIRWCGINSDVDDRRRAEHHLRAVQSNFSGWVESFPGLMVTMNMAGQVELFSKEVLEYFGKTREALSGWAMTDAVHPDDVARVLAAFTESVTTGKPYCIEHRCCRADGVYRWFQVRALAVRDADRQITGWYVVLVDIDDVKHAESATRRSEAFLLEVQRLSHTGGWRYDVATDIVESSPEIQRVYAPQPGENISTSAFWFDRIHPDDRVRVQGKFEQCVRDGTDYQAGYRIVLRDGSIKYQYATGHPILDAAGHLVEFIGASMDMTEHWQATNELHRASDALRELQATMSRAAQIATVGELAASIAHEVNQPLTGIITNASTCLRMLSADPPNVDGARDTARRAIRDGNRAADVITRLRALFSNREFTLESFDLSEATREVIALSVSDLRRNRVVLQSELADDLPPVSGDRVQLQQVILNLLRNASESMTEIHDRLRHLIVRTESDEKDRVRVTVRDAGVGIGPDDMNRIFDPFYTTKSGGMGVGLSVSRSIIESHHGRIWAAPNEGPGATFAFAIPCQPTRPLETREVAAPSSLSPAP